MRLRSLPTLALFTAAEQIQSARVVDSNPIAPTRTSYVSSNARVSNARPLVPFAQPPVVAHLNPATSVDRRTPQYTNDSRPFSQPANNGGGNNGQIPPPQNSREDNARPANNNAPNNNANAQQSRDGFRSFGPPAGANNSQPDNRNTSQQQQYQERLGIKFTPPQKAREEMYDVHPPLNQKQAQAPPRQEEQRSQSAPRSQPQESKDDRKK